MTHTDDINDDGTCVENTHTDPAHLTAGDTNQHNNSECMQSQQPGVVITIVDSSGHKTHSFPASKTRSISEDAEVAGIEIPTSCRAGACFVCAGYVKQGGACVDVGKISVPLIDIDEDQVLTCVGGVYDTCFSDGQFHEIVIQKDI